MRILHAIHDYLPRHRAGSEIYAARLAGELSRRHGIWILAAEYDPARAHGSLHWRVEGMLPVIEVVNNWRFASFSDTYRSPWLSTILDHVLAATCPHVVHVHSLLNLSFDLPLLARARGIPVVATLHDHSLVCPSGGQRVHVAEAHVCDEIEPERCARCFKQSPFYPQLRFGQVAPAVAARVHPLVQRLARGVPGVLSALQARAAAAPGPAVSADEIRARLASARAVFDAVDLFVSPSASVAEAHVALGLDPAKIRVSDYGFPPFRQVPRAAANGRLRIGFVGTLVWHKGAHVLLDAVRALAPDRYQLTLVGALDTFPGYVAGLRRQAADLPVRFAGAFGEGQTEEVFSQFDVLVVPSLWPENSPLVIHEAFMAGVPVVASRLGGTADLVTDAVNGLLYDAFSPDALAAALQTLIDEPDTLARLRTGMPAVKSIAEDARAWEQIYEQVLVSPAPALDLAAR